jgi:hypothetical protein
MKIPIENRFLSYCYNNEGEQNTEKYYFPEKNIVLSKKCEKDCSNPKKVHTTTYGKKLYYVNKNRDNNTCLDYFPIIKINFDSANSFVDKNNKKIYKFFDNSSYPNKITNNGVLYTKSSTDIFNNFYAYFNKNNMELTGKEFLNLYNSYVINILFKPNNLDGISYLISKGEKEYKIGIDNGSLFFEYKNKKNYFPIKLLNFQHYHLFITVINKNDNLEGRLFINNILIDNFSLNDVLVPNNERISKINIGKNFIGNIYFFDLYYFYFNNKKIKEMIYILDDKTLITNLNYKNLENSKKNSNIFPNIENNNLIYNIDLNVNDWSITVVKKSEIKKINNMDLYHLLSFKDNSIEKIQFKKYLNIYFDLKNSLIIYNLGDLNYSYKIKKINLDNFNKFTITYDSYRQLINVYLNDDLISKFNNEINIKSPTINFHTDLRLNRNFETTINEFKFYKRLLKPYDKTNNKYIIKNIDNTKKINIPQEEIKKKSKKDVNKSKDINNELVNESKDNNNESVNESQKDNKIKSKVNNNLMEINSCIVDKNKLNLKDLTKMEIEIIANERELKDKIVLMREKLQKIMLKNEKDNVIKELEEKYERMLDDLNNLNVEKICIQNYKNYYSTKIVSKTKNDVVNKLCSEQNKMKEDNEKYLKNKMDKSNNIIKKEDNKRLGNYYIDKKSKLWKQFDTLEKQFINYNKKELVPSNSINKTSYNYSNIQNDKLIGNDIKGNNNKVIDDNNKKEYDPNMIQQPDFCLSCYDKNKKHIMKRMTINDFDIREHNDFNKYTLKKYNCPK